MESAVVWIVETALLNINPPTWRVQTALAFSFKIILPFCLKISSNSSCWSVKSSMVCVHKVLVNFTWRTSLKSWLVQCRYTFLFFENSIFKC